MNKTQRNVKLNDRRQMRCVGIRGGSRAEKRGRANTRRGGVEMAAGGQIKIKNRRDWPRNQSMRPEPEGMNEGLVGNATQKLRYPPFD
jgi:hypothetical protein